MILYRKFEKENIYKQRIDFFLLKENEENVSYFG